MKRKISKWKFLYILSVSVILFFSVALIKNSYADSTAVQLHTVTPASAKPFVLNRHYAVFGVGDSQVYLDSNQWEFCPSNTDYYFEITPANAVVDFPGYYPLCLTETWGPPASDRYKIRYKTHALSYVTWPGTPPGTANTFIWTIWCYPKGASTGLVNPGGAFHALNACGSEPAGIASPSSYLLASGGSGNLNGYVGIYTTNRRCASGYSPYINIATSRTEKNKSDTVKGIVYESVYLDSNYTIQGWIYEETTGSASWVNIMWQVWCCKPGADCRNNVP